MNWWSDCFHVHVQVNKLFYYPTLLRRVQIMRKMSTNITCLYLSHSPNCTKDQKPWQVRILGKRKHWIINLLLDIFVCSIHVAVKFYLSFVFWLTLRARQNTAWLVNCMTHIQRYYTLKHLIRYICIYINTSIKLNM